MANISKEILDGVETYYTSKIREHGMSPQGVDWNGKDSQFLRFFQLMKVTNLHQGAFSINDLGCGYGALVDFLNNEFEHWTYTGVDVSADMIQLAKVRYADSFDRVHFAQSASLPEIADYSVASGIFNVKLTHDDDSWWSYLINTLDMMNEKSRHGFAFNCLTKYSDTDRMRDYLYYADPCRLFDWCKTRYSRQVALLHDYGLYEFTILVKKY